MTTLINAGKIPLKAIKNNPIVRTEKEEIQCLKSLKLVNRFVKYKANNKKTYMIAPVKANVLISIIIVN